MLNESVKNFLMGGAAGLGSQTLAKMGAPRDGGGASAGLAGSFLGEVRRIIESDMAVSTQVSVTRGGAGSLVKTAEIKVVAAKTAVLQAGYDSNKNVIGDTSSFDERLRQANDMMVSALMMVSELLGMPDSAKFEPGYVMEFDADCLDQLADIMWGIELTLQMFERIVPAGPDFIERSAVADVYPFSEMKNGGQLAEFTASLRVAKSHLELGMYMLDLQSVMAERIAVKYGAPVTFGMTQAANPSDLGMSVSDLAQVFGSLIREDMAAAVERLRMITSGRAEMTELERAALEMGAINSGILRAAMSGPDDPLSAFDFANVRLAAGAGINTAVDAGVDIGTDIGTSINTDTNVNVSNSNIPNSNINAGINTDINTNTVINTDIGTETNINTNINTNVSTDINTDINTGASTNINTGINTDINTDINTNTNINPDIDKDKNIKDKNIAAPRPSTGLNAEILAVGRANRNEDIQNLKNLKQEVIHADVTTAVKAEGVKADVKAAHNAAVAPVAVTVGESGVDDDIDLPISATEFARGKIRESVEAANRRASISADSLPARFVAAVNDGAEVPVSVIESAHGAMKAERLAGRRGGMIDKAAVAVPSSTRPAATVGGAVEMPISVMAAEDSRKAAGEKPVVKQSGVDIVAGGSTGATPEETVSAGQESFAKKERPSTVNNTSISARSSGHSGIDNGANISIGVNVNSNVDTDIDVNANVNTNVNTSVNTNVNTNTNANTNTAAGQSTESGVGIAFADRENAVEPLDNVSEIDTNDQDAAQVDVAGSKASQTVDKAERAASAFSRLDNEALIRQITEKMYQAVRNGAHEIRMVLRPESMGEMRMSIRVQGDVVIAKMQVENRQVKSIIESNMQSLKDELAKHNLLLDGFSVDVGADSDKSPREAWRDMAEALENSGSRKFRAGASGSADDPANNENVDPLTGAALGSDTGRRFGSNTFEYFI